VTNFAPSVHDRVVTRFVKFLAGKYVLASVVDPYGFHMRDPDPAF
jgi:hypothetical protein